MESKGRFDMKKHFRRIALAALTVAASLVLTGCGSQIARLEGHQLRLQRLSEANAERIAKSLARIEEDLKKLHVALVDLRAGNNRWTVNTAAPQEQKLQEIVRQNSQQLTNEIAAVEQNQCSLQEQTEVVHSNIQKVASAEGARPRLRMQRWKRQPNGAWQLQKAYEK
jgi:DNA repair exonuclease SbcCD nuclease subunit